MQTSHDFQNDNFLRLDDHENVASLMTVPAPGLKLAMGRGVGNPGAVQQLAVPVQKRCPIEPSLFSFLEGRQPQEEGVYFLVPRKLTRLLSDVTEDSSFWGLLSPLKGVYGPGKSFYAPGPCFPSLKTGTECVPAQLASHDAATM